MSQLFKTVAIFQSVSGKDLWVKETKDTKQDTKG